MNTPMNQIAELCEKYTAITGREARPQIYERLLWEFIHAGFTVEEFVTVVQYMLRENKRHEWQYSLRLGSIVGNHEKFMDILSECKAKMRVKPLTAQEKALQQLRPTGEDLTTTSTTTPAQTQVIAALQKHC